MKLLEFDIKKGIFYLEPVDLKVSMHSHPALEVVKSKKGRFSLETDAGIQNNLTFAIVDANTKHKMVYDRNEIVLLLIESNNSLLKEFLINSGIEMKNGVFTTTELANHELLMNDLVHFSKTHDLKQTNDKRVYSCIEVMESEHLKYKELMAVLTSKVLLSESRLSHLFKENVGTSIKKYHVWNKLKNALELFLNEEVNLKESSLDTEFYDQAHLSKAFKNYLGVNPTDIFNSRILQLHKS